MKHVAPQMLKINAKSEWRCQVQLYQQLSRIKSEVNILEYQNYRRTEILEKYKFSRRTNFILVVETFVELKLSILCEHFTAIFLTHTNYRKYSNF